MKRKRTKLKSRYEPCYTRLGAAIREQRKLHGMTLMQLAAKLKVSHQALANMEAGRQRIYLHHVFTIEKVLGISNYFIAAARGKNGT